MLEGLEDVRWDRLRHAYGAAGEVHERIRDLVAPDPGVRKAGLRSLASSIHHQGSVYSASLAAVPFLVEVLAHPSADVAEILDLLLDLALGDDANAWAWGQAFPPNASARGVERRVYNAVRAATPTYLRLLDHAEPEVRARVAYLLGWLDRAEVRETLRGRLRTEADERVLGSLALAVALLRDEEAVADLLPLVERPGVAGFAASVGLACLLAEHAPNAAIERLRSPPADARVPWHGGRLSELAHKALVRTAPVDRDERIAHLLSELERDPTKEAVQALVAAAFPEHRPYRPVPAHLSEAQGHVLARLASLGPPLASAWLFRSLRLPDDPDALRAYIDGTSALARPVAVGRFALPAWRVWLELGAGRLDPGLVPEAMLAVFPAPADLVDAALAAARGDVLPNVPSGDLDAAAERLVETAVRILEQAGPEVAKRLAARAAVALGEDHRVQLLGQEGAAHQREATILVATLVSTCERSGEILDERYDPLVARACGSSRALERRIVGHLPLERRERQVLGRRFHAVGREHRSGDRRSGDRRYTTAALGGWWVADLCPTPAVIAAVIDEIAARRRGEWGIEARVVEVLARFGAALVAPACERLAERFPRRDLLASGLAATEATASVPVLLGLLGDPAKGVREAAAEGLSGMPPPSVLPHLDAALASARGKQRKALEDLRGLLSGTKE
jgi:hypothetical protein